jgi:hypothetical protein
MSKQKTVTELVADLRGEITWFRNEARRHALLANQAALTTTQIAELVDQQVHVSIADKLAEWANRFDKAVKADG